MSAPRGESPPGKKSKGDAEAIRHLKQGIAGGKHWYIALLGAIRLWDSPEEVCHGRRYRYLIGGEAFDWLLLAERLLSEVRGLMPEREVSDLLFSGRPPIELSRTKFKDLIGAAKYKAHLNYVYGVVLEEALLMAAEEEMRKARSSMGYHGGDAADRAFIHVYSAPRGDLLVRFQEERSMPQGDALTLAEMREFTYWLFKYRMSTCDPERVASDTRKALSHAWRVGARNLNL
ncbi:MAG: hypothetical protein AB1603_04240 [Chloroflexota bacterium]